MKEYTKEQIVKASIKLIEEIAEQEGMEVVNRGIGHGFDGTIWNFKDDSEIPEVIAKNDNYSITLRSFWGSPEIDIRRRNNDGREELLVLNYSDFNVCDGKYTHTGRYHVNEIRVDNCTGYKKAVKDIYDTIDLIDIIVGEQNDFML